MRDWMPHVTVATVIVREDRYLLVEERDKASGQLVFNQPAGHLEQGETLPQAAVRETLEETCWRIRLRGVLGVVLYTAPANGITYCRNTFLAAPEARDPEAALDPDILATHWMSYEEMLGESARMRSPLVLSSVERHRRGICYPLDLIEP